MPRETPRKPTVTKNSPSKDPYAALRRPEQRPNRVEWSNVPAEAIRKLIHSAVTAGHAVTFGRSRDGGTLSATVHFDGGKLAIRQPTEDEMTEAMLEAAEAASEFSKSWDPDQS